MTTEANAKATSNRLVNYRLDPSQSRLMVQAFAEGLLSAFAHDPIFEVRDYSGEAEFNPDTFDDASVKVTIKAESISASTDVKEKDRNEIERTMRAEVLETTKYPEITFISSRVTLARLAATRYRATVIGDLTLHGVTQKNLWVSGEITLGGNDLKANGEFKLKQKDYGITLVSVAGGTLKVKNEVKCSFEITAVRT